MPGPQPIFDSATTDRKSTGQVTAGRFSIWPIIVLGFLALAVSFSARTALSLAMPVWARDMGWAQSYTSFVGAIALIVTAMVAPFAGNLVDRAGPTRLLACGLATLGAGLLLVSGAHQSWVLLLGFGLIGAIGFGMVAQHVVATTIALSIDRLNTGTTEKRGPGRGLATGLATSGSTGGQLLLVPLLALLLQVTSWRMNFLVLGIGCLLLAALFLLLRRGAPRIHRQSAADDEPLAQRLAFLLRSPVFHALFWSFLICGFTSTGAIETHLLPFAAWCGLPPLPSASAYGALSAVNLAGMIFAGWLTDRMNRPLLLGLIYILRAVTFVLLIVIAGEKGGDLPLLLIFSVAFGLVDYATVPVTASLVASHLGLRIMGLAMGLIAAGHALGGAAGAFLGGWLAQTSGSYDLLWYGALGLALLAGIIVLLLREKANGSHAAAQAPA